MQSKPRVQDLIDDMKKDTNLQIQTMNYNVPFIDEYDPKNPFGPNYEGMKHSNKKYYKLLKIKQFVHMEQDDQNLLRYGDVLLYGSIFYGFLIGLGAAKLFQYALPAKYTKLNRKLTNNRQIYYSFVGGMTSTQLYFYLGQHYDRLVVNPLYSKYLDKAISNGFQDYPISKDIYE